MDNQRKSLTRATKVRDPKLIVIATEGEKTEKQYFDAFASKDYYFTTNVKSKPLPTAKDGKSSPKDVIKRLDAFKRENKLKKNDELWVVIDRDRWRLEEIIKQCKQKNYKIALSNPCFELWLLLHIKSIIDENTDYKDKLLQNKKISTAKSARKFTSNEIKINNHGSYKSTNLDTSKFLPFVKTAIDRAKELDINPESDWPKSLGTRVYRLAQSILELRN